MPTVTKKYALTRRQFGGVPYGNKTSLKFTLETNSSGVMVDSNQATAIAANDIVRLGLLPAGTELHDALGLVSDAGIATSTADIGFAYVDGEDDANVPQDADYFFSGLALSSQGRTRANNNAVKPVVLPKDAYLILTNKVATQNGAMRVDVLADVILNGHP